MSIASTRNALCQGMNQGYWGITGPARSAKSNINDLWNQIESGLYVLKDTGFNDLGVLGTAVDDLQTSASAYYPGDQSEDMQTILQLLEDCLYLQGQQPVASILGSTTGIFDEIDILVDGTASSYPEFGIGGNMGSILDLLKGGFPGGLGLRGLLSQADQLINCLATLCGPGYIAQATVYADDLSDLYEEMHLYDSGPDQGLPMFDELYDEIGMDSTEKEAMDIVNEGIELVKQEALTAIEGSIAAVKTNTGTGGIFA